MRTSVWLQLAAVFAPLSLISFGGGLGVLGDMQREVVNHHHWMTQAQFLDDFAISRASAGPSSMIVPLIGWQVGGLVGAMVATLAIYAPGAVLFYGFTRAWTWRGFGSWPRKFGRGLAPVAIGLTLASSYSLLMAERADPLAWVVTAGALAVLVMTEVNPLIVMVGGAVVFVARTLLFH